MFKSCLIVVFSVFSWTFNAMPAFFFIDVMGSFLIAVAKAVKKHSFHFLSNPPLPFSLKKLFFCKEIFFFALYTEDKETLAWFRRETNHRFGKFLPFNPSDFSEI